MLHSLPVILLGGVLGLVLNSAGVPYNRWQYWAVFFIVILLMSI